MSQFDQAVIRWTGKSEKDILKFTRKVTIETMNRIIRKTPVDTGRARASWTVVKGHVPRLGTAPEEDAQGIAAERMANAKRAAGLNPGDKFIISNNVHYIGKLENGWSKQAPSGMVRLTIAEIKALVATGGLKP